MKGQMDIARTQVMGVLLLVVIIGTVILAFSSFNSSINSLTTNRNTVSNENYTVNSTTTYTLSQAAAYIQDSETITDATRTFTRDTNYTIDGSATITWLSANGNNSQVNVTYTTQLSSVAANATGNGETLVENITTNFGSVGTLIGLGILLGAVFVYLRYFR